MQLPDSLRRPPLHLSAIADQQAKCSDSNQQPWRCMLLRGACLQFYTFALPSTWQCCPSAQAAQLVRIAATPVRDVDGSCRVTLNCFMSTLVNVLEPVQLYAAGDPYLLMLYAAACC